MTTNKKAQMEVTFNWVYVLIAGGLILLFFGMIVVNQAKVSEDDLTREVVRIMDSIFSAAGVSENTKNVIDISGLAEYTLIFNCEEDITKFGIKGTSSIKEEAITPMFSPSEIKSTRLITWSVPYKFPFKVTDLLIITSENTAYLLWGESPMATELLKIVQNSSGAKNEVKLNIKSVTDFSQVNIGQPFQVRIIDVNGQIKNNEVLPAALIEKVKLLDDDKVTAVSFVGSNMVNYFQKEGDRWILLNKQKPITILSIETERDAAKYAAIFSGTPEIYQCNMNKALKRLQMINEIYGGEDIGNGVVGGKLGDLVSSYEDNSYLGQNCLNYLNANSVNVQDALIAHQMGASGCILKPSSCSNLIIYAKDLRDANKNLAESGDCISLY